MNKTTINKVQARPSDAGIRLDSFLSQSLSNLTRSAIQRLIADGLVTHQDVPLKKNYRLDGRESILVHVPDAQSIEIRAENLPLDIVYEDNDIIVVNKQRGMVVHPAAGNWNGTLVNALMYHCGDRLSGINGEIRPGIVHRIDKDTSGLLVVAKNDMAHQGLAAQIAAHLAEREYEAIVCGSLRHDTGTIDKPIARHKTDRKRMAVLPEGRRAVTHYHVIGRYNGYTHAGFTLETGRTHQIRVHMAHSGHPIIGDPIYGNKKDRFSSMNGQCLHAIRLKFTHPQTMECMEFAAPIPDYFCSALNKMNR